jgi:uncharacterized protein YxeA
MKKLLITILLLFCVALISAYIFIPAKIDFRQAIFIKVKQPIAKRLLTEYSNWNKWWPVQNNQSKQDTTVTTEANYSYKNYRYTVILKMIQGDSISISNNSTRINSLLNIIPINSDSVAVQWKGQSETTSDPIKRFTNYLQQKQIKNNIEELLQSMQVFLSNEKNLYGITIDQEKVKDTILIATRYSSTNYPTTSEIYTVIKNLKDYILKQGATETNYPMLNVTQDSGRFKTMVAIPVNKLIPANNTFLLKTMVPGKILITEVKGGDHTANEAIKLIEMYMNDYHLISPAIPFQSLVINRSKEPDTTKWVTKIYYPVM